MRSRTLAARLVEGGGVRLTRSEETVRVDKASRTLTAGDQLVFARGGRLFALQVVALGERRGSSSDARSLYRVLDPPTEKTSSGSGPNSR